METVSGWIVLACAALTATAATYLFFGAYHYRWRQSRKHRVDTTWVARGEIDRLMRRDSE